MDIALLIKSIIGLIAILAILIFLLFYSARKKVDKKPEVKKAEPVAKKYDLESLRAIIQNRGSSTKQLNFAIDAILKDYGVIKKKLGSRAHPDFEVHMNIIISLCRHPNTNKDLVLRFDKELTRLNPSYKEEIAEAVKRGLNSRG